MLILMLACCIEEQENMLLQALLSCESLIINQNKLFISTTSDHFGNFPPSSYQNSCQQFPAFNERLSAPKSEALWLCTGVQESKKWCTTTRGEKMFSVIARQTGDRAGRPEGLALPLGQKTKFGLDSAHLWYSHCTVQTNLSPCWNKTLCDALERNH